MYVSSRIEVVVLDSLLDSVDSSLDVTLVDVSLDDYSLEEVVDEGLLQLITSKENKASKGIAL